NDDTVSGGMGFGTHPHDNMEIVTIPLEGEIKHRDSMGNEGVVGVGEIQVMSAGTGVEHSEMNASQTGQVKLLQLWVVPEIENVEPRYDQKAFDLEAGRNALQTVVAPHDWDEPNALWIYQQAFFNLGVFDGGKKFTYEPRISGNGAYVFLIDGEIIAGGEKLLSRDALEATNFDEIEIEVVKPSKILVIEVPMTENKLWYD